jgi:hypothetical protein
MKDERRNHPFRDSHQDAEAARHIPDTPRPARPHTGWPLPTTTS